MATGIQSSPLAASGALQRQQAQRQAEQASRNADRLQSEANQARNEANQASRRASSLESDAQDAQSTAQQAQQTVAVQRTAATTASVVVSKSAAAENPLPSRPSDSDPTYSLKPQGTLGAASLSRLGALTQTDNGSVTTRTAPTAATAPASAPAPANDDSSRAITLVATLQGLLAPAQAAETPTAPQAQDDTALTYSATPQGLLSLASGNGLGSRVNVTV